MGRQYIYINIKYTDNWCISRYEHFGMHNAVRHRTTHKTQLASQCSYICNREGHWETHT